MTKKMPTYNDIRDGKPAELMKTYKITPAQLETAIRRNNDGASQGDLRREYDKFYKRNRRDA